MKSTQKKLWVITLVLGLSISLKSIAQTVDSRKLNNCEQDVDLIATINSKTKKVTIKLGQDSIIKNKNISDDNMEAEIKKALTDNVDLTKCNKPAVIAAFQELIEKYPAYITSRLKKPTNTVTRHVKISSDYTLEEILNLDYSYTYCLVSTDPNKIGSTIIILSKGTGSGSTYSFSATSEKVVQSSIVTIIKFIRSNKDVAIDNIYLVVKDTNQQLLLNSTITGDEVSSSDKISISAKQKDSLNFTISSNKITNQTDEKIYTVDGTKDDNASAKDNVKAPSKRISFGVGIGPAILLDHIYQLPVVDKSNNNVVIIEGAQRTAINVSLGLVYTPFYYKLTDPEHPNGELIPKGISFAAFANPVNLLKYSDDQSVFNPVDFGIGIGYKTAGSITIMGTFNLTGIRQPKQWFIDKYSSSPQSYSIPGPNNTSISQQTFDTTDNDLFRTKLIASIGFKVCFTFDIIKAYGTAAAGNK